jgi:hypothetical protein
VVCDGLAGEGTETEGGAFVDAVWYGFLAVLLESDGLAVLLQPAILAITRQTSAQREDEIRMVSCPLKTDGNGPAPPSTSLSTP